MNILIFSIGIPRAIPAGIEVGGKPRRQSTLIMRLLHMELLQQKTKTIHGTGTFPWGGYDQQPSPSRFLGYKFEDWNWAIWTLKLCAYQANDSRKSTTTDSNTRTIAARSNIIMLPYYLTADDKANLVEDDALSDASNDNDTLEQKDRKR